LAQERFSRGAATAPLPAGRSSLLRQIPDPADFTRAGLLQPRQLPLQPRQLPAAASWPWLSP